MNKKEQARYNRHYNGTILFGIWWVVVSIVSIALGILIEPLGVLIIIGIVLLILIIGALVIAYVLNCAS
jgi:hypothetical protein